MWATRSLTARHPLTATVEGLNELLRLTSQTFDRAESAISPLLLDVASVGCDMTLSDGTTSR